MKRIDVLNLQQYSFSSRDREQATLVCNYLRYMGYNVVERSSWRGFFYINKLKPKVLYLANISGATKYIKLAQYCQEVGINVLSGDTEGNVKESYLIKAFWGHYKQKVLFEDIHTVWSHRVKNILTKEHPELTSKLKVCGAPGFDIYRISSFIHKKEFLKKHHKSNYSKVIGFACWDFGPFFPQDHRHAIICKQYDNTTRERFENDRKALNGILLKAIKNNPDTLFILKEHPLRKLGDKASAIQGCNKYDNTLILVDEPIVNCISASDFWISYESTTAVEAWLLDKKTGLINPSGTDFPRANVHDGSPNYSTFEAFQKAIDTFYSSQKLPGFDELHLNRKKIITSIIEWDDGLNHVRIGNQIIKLIEKNNNTPKRKPFRFFKTKAIELLAPIFKHKFRYESSMQKKFNNAEVEKFAKARKNEQISFYIKCNLNKQQLAQL